MTNIQSAIQALLASASITNPIGGRAPTKPMIAISRDHGALGREIANALSARLNMPVYDREIMAKIAERLNADPDMVQMLDESAGRARDMWLVRLLTGLNLSEDSYRMHLINVILSLSKGGGIVLGRGSNVILSTSCALRVRITASPEVCAARLAAKKAIPLAEATELGKMVNHARGQFVWDLFKMRNSDAHNFDLVVNTDRITDIDATVDMLIAAYKAVEVSQVLD